MNPLLKMAMDKVLNDPEMIASGVKMLVESLQKGAKEREELRASVLRTQRELLELREDFNVYREAHP